MRPNEVKDDCKDSGLSNWINWMVVSFSLMENTGGVAGLGEEHRELHFVHAKL